MRGGAMSAWPNWGHAPTPKSKIYSMRPPSSEAGYRVTSMLRVHGDTAYASLASSRSSSGFRRPRSSLAKSAELVYTFSCGTPPSYGHSARRAQLMMEIEELRSCCGSPSLPPQPQVSTSFPAGELAKLLQEKLTLKLSGHSIVNSKEVGSDLPAEIPLEKRVRVQEDDELAEFMKSTDLEWHREMGPIMARRHSRRQSRRPTLHLELPPEEDAEEEEGLKSSKAGGASEEAPESDSEDNEELFRAEKLRYSPILRLKPATSFYGPF